MGDTSRFSALLAEKGLRLTRQRESVAEAIVEAKGAFTAQELHDSLRASAADVGLTTVYRTLEILSEAGVVERVHGLRGCEAFVVAGRSHSHTIVCSSCGAASELVDCGCALAIGEQGGAEAAARFGIFRAGCEQGAKF